MNNEQLRQGLRSQIRRAKLPEFGFIDTPKSWERNKPPTCRGHRMRIALRKLAKTEQTEGREDPWGLHL